MFYVWALELGATSAGYSNNFQRPYTIFIARISLLFLNLYDNCFLFGPHALHSYKHKSQHDGFYHLLLSGAASYSKSKACISSYA